MKSNVPKEYRQLSFLECVCDGFPSVSKCHEANES